MTSSNQFHRQSGIGTQSGKPGFGARKTGMNSPGVEVNSFLRSEIAHLLPAIANITKLQKECAAALPQLFLYCQVLHLESEQLTVAAPNSALASKLKQQLPRLQAALQKAGWQINAIRIKVQVNPVLQKESVPKQLRLPDTALKAFSDLEQQLSGSRHNEGLLAALRTLIKRER
jgi:hypothetical protein